MGISFLFSFVSHFSSFVSYLYQGTLSHVRKKTIVNSTAVNIGIQVSFSILVSSGHMASSAITGSYGSFGEGSGTPLQYCCLENPMDGGAWWVAVHGVAKSWT